MNMNGMTYPAPAIFTAVKATFHMLVWAIPAAAKAARATGGVIAERQA